MYRMTRRDLIRSSALLTGGAALAACAPKAESTAAPAAQAPAAEKPAAQPTSAPAQPTAAPAQPTAAPKPAADAVEVRYMSWWGVFNTGIFPEVTKDFNDVFPNISVKLEEVPYAEAQTKYQTSLVAGNAPDILYHMNFMSQYYDRDLILPLDAYFDASELDYWEDFYGGLAVNDWEGRVYGFPHMLHTCLMLYNKTMIEKEWGQDLWEAFPDGMWTIDDLIEVAQACTKDTDGNGVIDQWGLYIYHRSWYYAYETLGWTMGDSVFDIENVKFNFTSEIMDKVAHDLFDWVRKDKFVIGQEDYAEVTKASGASTPFFAGKTAIRHRLMGDVGTGLQAIGDKFEWDLFYLPNSNDGKLAISEANGHGHNIAHSTKVPDAAWEYVKFLGTTPGLMYLARDKASVPPYFKDPALRDALVVGNPEHDNVIIDTIEQRGGYGDHMRFHNEGELLNLFINRLDELYNRPYEDAKQDLSRYMKELEDELNGQIQYGDELPFTGLTFPFPPSKKA